MDRAPRRREKHGQAYGRDHCPQNFGAPWRSRDRRNGLGTLSWEENGSKDCKLGNGARGGRQPEYDFSGLSAHPQGKLLAAERALQ